MVKRSERLWILLSLWIPEINRKGYKYQRRAILLDERDISKMVLDVKISEVSLFVANYVDTSKNPNTFIVRTRFVT